MAAACSDQKKAAIKASLSATKAKRKDKEMSSIEFKLDLTKLSKLDAHHLKMIFVEAKRLHNWYLSDISRLINRNPSAVEYLNKDSETCLYSFKYISSQMIQAVNKQVKDNLAGLKASKEKGRKVGRLKFKSEFNAIDLAQPGITFLFRDQKLKLQGLKAKIPLFGYSQLPTNADLCNAKLIQKPSGVYLKVTISRLKSVGYGTIGLDFGIKHQITTSEGIRLDYRIPVSKRTKKLQRQLSRKKKGSKNRLRAKKLLGKAHEIDTNKRKDCVNKVVGYLKTFKIVVYQNDSIKGWQRGRFGRRIQQTAIGAIKARVKNLASSIEVGQFVTTTKPCSNCGTIKPISLSARIYDCEACGFKMDRDQNSGVVIERLGCESKQIPTERRKFTPVETLTSARQIMASPYLTVSSVAESGSLPL